MATPKEMDVVRRAYELWQQAGEPSGKDDEFYHQAKKELQEALDREHQPRRNNQERQKTPQSERLFSTGRRSAALLSSDTSDD